MIHTSITAYFFEIKSTKLIQSTLGKLFASCFKAHRQNFRTDDAVVRLHLFNQPNKHCIRLMATIELREKRCYRKAQTRFIHDHSARKCLFQYDTCQINYFIAFGPQYLLVSTLFEIARMRVKRFYFLKKMHLFFLHSSGETSSQGLLK